MSAAVSALGGLDVVVSNAGAGWSGRFETMSPAEIDSVLDINLRVPVHLANAAAPHLLNSEAGGQLVLVGSIVGLVGVAEEVAYGAAKYGLRGLADGLRSEWARDTAGRRMTVTLVSPGVVDTPFFTRRNREYQRSWPKPMPVSRVARLIVSSIEHRRQDVVVPGWLLLAGRPTAVCRRCTACWLRSRTVAGDRLPGWGRDEATGPEREFGPEQIGPEQTGPVLPTGSVLVVMPAYNAARTLRDTWRAIPPTS